MSRARRVKNRGMNDLGDFVSKARMRNFNVGPRKVRMVADLIRGMTVAEAQKQLLVTHRPSGVPILGKLLNSAFCNANQSLEKTDAYGPGDLVIGKLDVDGGAIQYRFQPMSMGRAGKIRKRSCHITLELYENPEAAG